LLRIDEHNTPVIIGLPHKDSSSHTEQLLLTIKPSLLLDALNNQQEYASVPLGSSIVVHSKELSVEEFIDNLFDQFSE